MDIIHYIYLLQTKHSIDKNERVYKIGRTNQTNYKRILQYPNQTVVLHQTICSDSVYYEYQIIKFFKDKYIQIRDYGYEYFQGDCNDMIHDINTLIKLPIIKDFVFQEQNNQENNPDFIDKYNDDILSIIEKNKTEMLSIINNNKNEIIETIVNSSKFCCEKCNYYTNTKQDFEKHILTKKHIDNKIEYKYECKNCNKKYNSRSGLWNHKNICKEVKPEQSVKEILPKMEKMINEITELKNIILVYSKNK